MHDPGLQAAGLQDDLRASDSREWQLWFMTLGFLLIFALGSIVAAYFLLQTSAANSGLRQAALRLLGGLAILTALFCLYVFQARLSVSRFKLFLNEMSGMATGNLEFQDCLDSIVAGMSRTCRVPFSRFLLIRPADSAVAVAATFHLQGPGARPDQGHAHALADLALFSKLGETLRPAVLDAAHLEQMPVESPERLLLTGGLPGISCVLVLPVWTPAGVLGFLVLGRQRAGWRGGYRPHEMTSGMMLAGHAGRVVQEAVRRRDSVRDPLTGLYNRRHFKERVEQEIKRAHRNGHTTALLLCDLDRFKQVNDTHGHQTGDQVLKAAATAIKAATRGTDLHFRWGGDELVVVLSNTTSDGVLRAAERIRERIRSFTLENGLNVDMSIGIALYPEHGRDQEELLRVADLAMYVAKKSGDKVRVGYETYQLDEQCVRFVYQPIMDLRSGGVHGHEIFARDPGGQLSPLELFDKYRAVGQLDSLKRLIFEQQLRQAALAGVSRLFVNTEIDFLAATDPLPVPTGVDVILEIADLGPGRGQEGRLAGLARWRQAGYKMALAGFGADFSSLHLMESIRPEYIKVARDGLVQAESSEDYRGFLGHLLQAATSLVAPLIVCEGVESRAQLTLVGSLGAPLAQGFLLGRPEEKVRLPGQPGVGGRRPGVFPFGPELRA